jgi:hypothetical protein
MAVFHLHPVTTAPRGALLKATLRDPQVKTPAPGCQTGSHPKISRRHGQPAPPSHATRRHRVRNTSHTAAAGPGPQRPAQPRIFTPRQPSPRMQWLPMRSLRNPGFQGADYATPRKSAQVRKPAKASVTLRIRRLQVRVLSSAPGQRPFGLSAPAFLLTDLLTTAASLAEIERAKVSAASAT